MVEESKLSDHRLIESPEEAFTNMLAETAGTLLGQHLGIQCVSCQIKNFGGLRYQCSICEKHNLCGDCFERRRQMDSHEQFHPVFYIPETLTAQRNDQINDVIKNKGNLSSIVDSNLVTEMACRYCQSQTIKGPRFQCFDLGCVGHNFCEDCSQGKEAQDHMKRHSVIIHLDTPLTIKFDVDKDVEYLDQKQSQGCFGSVRKVLCKGKVAALKRITVDSYNPQHKRLMDSYKREIRAYPELLSNKIVRFYGCSEKEEGNSTHFYILTEFMEGGTLEEVISDKRNCCLRTKFEWILSLVKGIRRIHDKGFVHKDIKPDNILLDSKGDIKIGDMGIATISPEGKYYFYETVAPVFYAAPEIRTKGRYTRRADIFSLGLVINQLFTYERHSRSETDGDKGKTVKFSFPTKSKYLWPIIHKCTKHNSNDRPRASEIELVLEKFDKYFLQNLGMKEEEYSKLEVKKRDNTFIDIYSKYQKTLKRSDSLKV